MKDKHLHIADENLLLHASGELDANVEIEVQAHLERCMECRDRLHHLQSTLAEFAATQWQQWAAKLPEIDRPRAALQARLAELTAETQNKEKSRAAWLGIFTPRYAAALAGTVFVVLLLLTSRVYGPSGKSPITMASITLDKPDWRLTPGATIPVTTDDVCGSGASKYVPSVPVSLKQKVFELYGVTPPQPDAYEVDYLITPELGGATDIRNLWPEPYHDTLWNAHVKDQLEDRLHRMVCHGDVDLATAQHDISTDWIAAYHKYFHTDMPLSDTSSESTTEPKLPRKLPTATRA
jgi:hypothetical protein